MVLTPHGGVTRCETRAGSVLRVLIRRRSALKTRHHYTTPKYTSTVLAALAILQQYGAASAMLERANWPIRAVLACTPVIRARELGRFPIWLKWKIKFFRLHNPFERTLKPGKSHQHESGVWFVYLFFIAIIFFTQTPHNTQTTKNKKNTKNRTNKYSEGVHAALVTESGVWVSDRADFSVTSLQWRIQHGGARTI